MRIGIDCRLPTYRMGGISQYTIYLIQALARINAGQDFNVLQSWKERRSFIPRYNARFSRSNSMTPSHHKLERYLLAAELVPHRLDVFHSPDFIPPAFGATRRVITIHDLTFLLYPQFLTEESKRYYTDQIEWAVAQADHIMADSEATRVDIIKLLGVPAEKVTTVYLAVNPIFLTDHPPQDIQDTIDLFGLGRGYILAVGTLEPRKNIPSLLHAYGLARTHYGVDVPLVLVGGRGWIYDDIFQTIADLRLTDHVHHLSNVTDLQLAHLYRAAGVLAFPSHYEGFGLPALEAMHSSCPVIVSNRGSLPEIVGEAALSLNPDDTESWAEGLGRILEDAAWADELRRLGRTQAQQFSWDKTAAKALEIYTSG